MRTKITIVLLIVIAVAAPVLVLRAQETAQTIQTAQAIANTEFTVVERGTVQDFIETLGDVEASAVSDLSFPISGAVNELYVDVGDYVAEGSILAVLDNGSEIVSYEQAALALNRAQASEFDIQNVDDDEIALAEANVDAAWAAYAAVLNGMTPDDRAAMEADYQQALANAAALGQEASTAPGGYGSAAYNLLTAEAGEAAFQAEITRLQNEQSIVNFEVNGNAAYGRVLEAQAQLEQTLAGPSPNQLTQAALNVQQAEQQLANLQGDYEDTFLVAPFDGYLSDIDLEVGATVLPNNTVMQLTDITPLLLTISIDETDLGDVMVGMPVEVRFDALPDVVMAARLGEIAELGTTVNGIVTYDANVLLEEFPAGVRVGMSADVRLITEQTDNVISIPNSYLREDRETGVITVQIPEEDGSLVEREIVLGLRGIQNSQVVDGLDAGDVIALRDAADTPGGGFGPPGGGGGPFDGNN